MPTDTFNRLPEEKKTKIIEAARKEFSRMPLAEASIKNITQTAEIARGSFYQYFESKEDLLQFMLQEHVEKMRQHIKVAIIDSKGDLFAAFIAIYDYAMECCRFSHNGEEHNFFRNIYENVKLKQEDEFLTPHRPWQEEILEEYSDLIDMTTLKIQEKQELKVVIGILSTVTRKAILASFEEASLEEARKMYLHVLDYIKYGIVKPDKENKNRKETSC